MKIQLVILLFCFFFSLNASGQVQSAPVLSQPSLQLLEEELLTETNQSIVEQQGVDNSVSVLQRQAGLEANLAEVMQNGNFNSAILQQQGSGNQAAVLQNGLNNSYELNLTGEGNIIGVVQNGNENSVLQNLEGVRNLEIEILQEGNENEIIQELNGNSNMGFQIIQSGNGLKAVIRQ